MFLNHRFIYCRYWPKVKLNLLLRLLNHGNVLLAKELPEEDGENGVRPKAEKGGREALVEAAQSLSLQYLEGTVKDALVDGALARHRVHRLVVQSRRDDI